MKQKWQIQVWLMLWAILSAPLAHAETDGKPEPATKGEKVDLKSIQKDYWTKQPGTEVEAVQNRLYTKTKKFELGLFGASLSTDPFLNVRGYGASVGFHLNEYFGIKALYYKDSVSLSKAHDALVGTSGVIAATNYPKDLLAGEIMFYPLYGKMSLLGKSIFYGDTFISLGAGRRATESGNYPTILLGVGGQLYLSRFLSVRLDYRAMYFREKLLQKYPASQVGADLGNRTEISGMVTLGLTFLFGLF